MLLRESAVAVAGGARSATVPVVVVKSRPTAKDGLGSATALMSRVPHSRARVVVAVLVITMEVAEATEIGATGPFADGVVAAGVALAERGSPLPRPGLDAAWLY